MAEYLLFFALVLTGPCAGLLAVAAMALLHEDLGRGRLLPLVPRRVATRRASACLLRTYLEDAAGARGPAGLAGAEGLFGAAQPWWRRLHRAQVAAVTRRADAWLLEEYLAARREALAPGPAARPAQLLAPRPAAGRSRTARLAALPA